MIKLLGKFCSVAAMAFLVFAALGPAKWVPRSGLGWQLDHFVGYFGITWLVCFAWSRPLVVGGAFIALSAVLESLQIFTPDRTFDLWAVFYGGSGVVAAAVPAELFIRAQRAVWAQAT
jgi:hypothetical protein